MNNAPGNFVPLIIVVLIVFRVATRIRRNIGPQRLRPAAMMTRIVIYAVLTGILGWVSLAFGKPTVFVGMIAGLAPGAGLALWGLNLTKFETRPDGRFYAPNPYIGVAVSTLLVARLGYRMMVISERTPQSGAPQLFQSPMTFFFFGVLAGYYMTYYAGVLAKSRLEPVPAS